MGLSILEPLLVEAQLVAGCLGLIGLAATPRFRNQGLDLRHILQIAREGWTIAFALVAFNALGICLASFSSLAGVKVGAEVIEFLAASILFVPLLVKNVSGGSFLAPENDRNEKLCIVGLVLALLVRAFFAALAVEWSFAFVLFSLMYAAVAATHIHGISWASAQLKSRSTYLAGASSMRSVSSILILFGLNSTLLAVLLLPFAVLAQLFGHAIDPWNTLAPIFIKSSETATIHASLMDRDTLVDALLRLCVSGAFFVLSEKAGGKEAYVAFTAVTSLRRIFEAPQRILPLLAYAGAVGAAVVYLYSVYSSKRSVSLSDSTFRGKENNSSVHQAAEAFSLGEGEDGDHIEQEETIFLPKGSRSPPAYDGVKSFQTNRLFTTIVAVVAVVALTIDCLIGAYTDPTTFDWSNVDTRGNTKWIVVTTISLPTSTMEALCALPDWEVAVVADKKTPKQWRSGHCHFLSVRDQMRLPFQIVRHIPFKAYTRKNIGYLYAIANGATTIFDTDDDNLPTEEIVLEDPDSDKPLFGYRSDMQDRETANIYAHFGRSDIWPRGYPLDHIDSRERLDYLNSSSAPASLNGRALVQQGLADLDPDVDAIFRLLHPQDITTVKFCRDAPTLKLARGILSPFNSQNTFWHRDAFWGLLLPITVTFRVTDIMRGYWVQRILWDIGGLLSFRRPSVDQIRNVHNYLIDFESELQLYSEAGDLTEFLHTWTSEAVDVPGRIGDLFRALVANKFIKRGDQQLVKAWLADLKLVGYEFPPLDVWSRGQALRDAETSAVAPQAEEFTSSMDWLNFKCHLKDPPKPVFQETLLVVVFNTPFYQVIPTFEDIYKDFFPHIVYYGPLQNKGDPRVIEIDIGAGELGYRAFMHAVENNPGYKNYLWTNDDVGMNPYALSVLDKDRFWMSKSFFDGFGELEVGKSADPDHPWWVWNAAERLAPWVDAFNALPQQAKDRAIAASQSKTPTMFGAQNDFFNLPARLAPEFTQLLEPFSTRSVWHELVFRTIVYAMPPNETDWNIPEDGATWLWFGERINWKDVYLPMTYVAHPLKLSSPESQAVVHQWLISAAKWWQHFKRK